MPLIFCSKCDECLEDCTCPDLAEKIEWLDCLRNHGIWIGPAYMDKLRDRAAKTDPEHHDP